MGAVIAAAPFGSFGIIRRLFGGKLYLFRSSTSTLTLFRTGSVGAAALPTALFPIEIVMVVVISKDCIPSWFTLTQSQDVLVTGCGHSYYEHDARHDCRETFKCRMACNRIPGLWWLGMTLLKVAKTTKKFLISLIICIGWWKIVSRCDWGAAANTYLVSKQKYNSEVTLCVCLFFLQMRRNLCLMAKSRSSVTVKVIERTTYWIAWAWTDQVDWWRVIRPRAVAAIVYSILAILGYRMAIVVAAIRKTQL